jgi:HlyD family secretion protein
MKPLENRPHSLSRPTKPRLPATRVLKNAGPIVPRRPSILKRVVVTGVVGSGLGFVALQLSHMPGAPPDYKTEKVRRGTLVREVIASGPLVPALRAEVNSVVAGTVLAVNADFGSEVEAGQPLAEIDPAIANLTLREAQINLGSSRATVQVTRTRLEQSKALMTQGLLPKIEYEKAAADLGQAEGNARIAESNVARARIEVARCTVRSPLTGIVVTRNVSVGQSVDTGKGSDTPPLFVVASDLSKMQIEANVAESDIGGVRPGMEAGFTVDAFPEETFKGRVTQVRTIPIVDQTVVTYPVLIETSNEDLRLKPGMTASVSIVVDQREDVLTIPNKALRFRPADARDAAGKKGKSSGDKREKDSDDDGGTKASSSARRRGAEEAIVYRVESSDSNADGKGPKSLEKVAIKTGLSDGKDTEVLEGLSEGDRLVVGLKKSADEKSGLFARLPEILSGGAGKKKGP